MNINVYYYSLFNIIIFSTGLKKRKNCKSVIFRSAVTDNYQKAAMPAYTLAYMHMLCCVYNRVIIIAVVI